MPSWRSGWQRRAWSCSAGLLCALLASLLTLTPFVEQWEQRSLDRRFLLRGQRPTRARIVIAAIADSTLEAWSDPMVFWGAHHAAAITAARRLGASWIGLDFIQAVSGGSEADQQFALALRGGRVVLSQKRFSQAGSVNPIAPLLFAHPDQMANIGFIDSYPEMDDTVRRAAIFNREGERFSASLAAVLALRLRGQSPTDPGALQALSGTTHGAGSDTLWINYVGPPHSFPHIPVERLAAGQLNERERTEIRGAVVLIGPTYSAANDQYRGPGGVYYHGVEINAHTLATLLDRRPLHRAYRGQEAVITGIAGAFLALLLTGVPIGWGLVLAAAIAGAWWWGSVRAFAGDAIWPTAGPLLAIGLTTTGHAITSALEEARRRRQIQGLFGRYVTPDIVDYLLRHPSHLQLGGEECEVSVLFVDIRGHTLASQGRQPAVVLNELNELFCQITPVIQRHGGLLYGFRGDGFLAVFGAPRPVENHAQAGVDAAVELIQVTRRVSAARTLAGKQPVRVGCSINSGRVVCGNLGGEERAEYSVIGDTVNVAARLEELNKSPVLNEGSPSEIVISHENYQRLQSPPPVLGPFEFAIRGREGMIQVYKVEVTDVRKNSVQQCPADIRQSPSGALLS
jgi:adenylate cyclase